MSIVARLRTSWRDRQMSSRWLTSTEVWMLIGCGLVAGLIALLSEASPTGTTPIDAVLLVASFVLLCWASGTAPWWIVAGFAVVAAALAAGGVVLGVAVLGFALAVLAAVPRFDRASSLLRAASAGVSANALLWSPVEVFFGFTAAVSLAAAVVVIVSGIWARPTHVRRRAVLMVAAVGVLVCVTLVGVGLAANSARDDLTTGSDVARRAVTELQSGDYATAAASFELAADLFEQGADHVDGPLTAGGRFIPAVAQNLTAGRDITRATAGAADQAAVALRRIDPAAMTLAGGGVDIDELRSAEQELLVVRGAIDELSSTVDEVSSPWLAAPLRDQVSELRTEIDENEPRIDSALNAVALAPAMLGADEPRHYLVLFTTPAEARGLGGFTGNYAEMVVTDGVVEVEEFGRSRDINERLAAAGADCNDCPDEFLDAYGVYGFTTGPGGGVGPLAWFNITMPARFPLVAETAATLYHEAGGDEIDGVIVMDPYVVAELMRYTGPIDVSDLDTTVAADDVAEFLIADQYELAEDKDTRVDALETLGSTAITRILESTLPSPIDLADGFGPLVEERRLLFWSSNDDEQLLLDDVGLLGELPALSDDDGGFSVAVTNASGNKIDSFLEREVSVHEERTPEGERLLVADVTLTNTAPTSGLPDYIIDNEVGLPTGTSRLLVTFYGPSDLESVTRDGQPIGVERFVEGEWFGHRHAVDILSGGTVEYRVVFSLDEPRDGTFEPTIWDQPLRR